MARPRDWDRISRSSRRRWIAAYGGPRRLPPERRAERARRAYEAGSPLPVEHTGHAGPVERRYSQIVTTEGVREVSTAEWREGNRLGDYAADTRRLLSGDLESEDFARRWRKRKRSAGGYELEADPDRVIAALTEAGPPPEPFYTRRPVPRRRR